MEQGTLEDVTAALSGSIGPKGWEYVAVGSDAIGRILAEDLVAPVDLPLHNVCSMDGFLVRLAQVQGAPLKVMECGSCGPGELVEEVPDGGAILAYTGCMVKYDDVALVPLEEASRAGEWITIPRRPEALENIERRGSSVRAGSIVLARGHRVRPIDVEAIRMLGRDLIKVYIRPRVGVISVGSEITMGVPGDGRETTRHLTAEAVVRRLGAIPMNLGVVEDSRQSIADALDLALEASDVVLTIGGTGPSSRDLTAQAIELLSPSYSFRGLDVADVRRVSGAIVDGKPLIALPGPRPPLLNGLVLLASRVISAASGASMPPEIPVLASVQREVDVRHRGMMWFALDTSGDRPVADPIMPDRSGISLVGASGYALVSPGILRGELWVHVPEYV